MRTFLLELCPVRCESSIPREGLSGCQGTVTRAMNSTRPSPVPCRLLAEMTLKVSQDYLGCWVEQSRIFLV